jgi:hypothetical protein
MKCCLCLGASLLLLVAGCRKEAPAPVSDGTTKNGGPLPTSSGKQPPLDQSQEVTVTAEQLANDYVADANAADAKYKNRTLILTGYIDFVVKDVAGQTLVVLEGAPAKGKSIIATYVRCTSPTAVWVQKANEMKKGQKLTVRGRCVGSLASFVDVMDCTVLQVGAAETTEDRASLVKEVEQAGAGIELAPIEFKVNEVSLRMLAPKGATTKSSLSGVLVRHGDDFAVRIDFSRNGFLDKKRDELSGRPVVESDDVLLLRTTMGSFEFSTTIVCGHQDFCLSSSSFVDNKIRQYTRAQCLLMLKCAWTLQRKDQVPAEPLAALKHLKVDLTEEAGKVTRVYLPSYVGTDATVALLADLTELEELSLSGATDDGLKHLRKLKNLRRLRLEGRGYTDRCLTELKHWPALVELSLADTRVTDKGLEHLQAVPQLEVLALRLAPFSSSQVTDAGLKHLAKLDKLRFLDLHCCAVTDAGLVHLKGLKNLEFLGLSGSEILKPRITDKGLEALEALTRLQSLDVRYQGISDAGEQRLRQAIKGIKIQRK